MCTLLSAINRSGFTGNTGQHFRRLDEEESYALKERTTVCFLLFLREMLYPLPTTQVPRCDTPGFDHPNTDNLVAGSDPDRDYLWLIELPRKSSTSASGTGRKLSSPRLPNESRGLSVTTPVTNPRGDETTSSREGP